LRLNGWKYPNFTGDQKTQRFNGEPDPADICHDRDTFAAGGVLEPEVKIIPRSPRKSGIEFVIEANLVVPFQGFLDGRDQDVLAVPHRHLSLCNDAHDISGKAFNALEHWPLLESHAKLADEHLLLAPGV
jgi:hypothetical protein